MKLLKRLSALLIIAALFLSAPATIMAYDPTSVSPSQTLEVYLKTSEGTALLHTYNTSEMNKLTSGSNVYYSGIDALPWTVETVATGVYLEDLLDDAKKYTEMDVWQCESLRFDCTDGASKKFSLDDLIHTKRYYFQNIHGVDGGINEDGEVACDPGKGKSVKTMLAIDARQQRLPNPGGEGRDTNPEQFTLLFGMTETEVSKAKQRVSEYRRGIEKMTIDMGNVKLPPASVAVTSVSLDRSTANLDQGKNLQLTAIVSPANATNQKVIWKSSNEAVAKVSSTGVVSGVSGGTVVITAAAEEDQTKKASCTFTISINSGTGSPGTEGGAGGTGTENADKQKVSPTSVKMDRTTLNLLEGAEKKLTATVSPSNASYDKLIWKSSNEKVATVSSNGTVKGVASGKAVITATVDDSNLKVTCEVIVTKEQIAATGLTLDQTELTLKTGGMAQLKATVTPANATEDTVLWSSNTPGVAAVDTSGKVTAKSSGTAQITAKIEGTKISAVCTVRIEEEKKTLSDLSGHWGEKEITAMIESGFANGYEDGSFRPNASITRAEFITMLVRILENTKGIPSAEASSFTDTAGHWAQKNISAAVSAGITGGYGNGNFGPNDLITREQVAVMLANASGSGNNSGNVAFADGNRVSSWAADKVNYAAGNGWLKGYEDNTFRPGNSASRAEVCTMLLRFYQQLGN